MAAMATATAGSRGVPVTGFEAAAIAHDLRIAAASAEPQTAELMLRAAAAITALRLLVASQSTR
jgi:hypothetical protein